MKQLSNKHSYSHTPEKFDFPLASFGSVSMIACMKIYGVEFENDETDLTDSLVALINIGEDFFLFKKYETLSEITVFTSKTNLHKKLSLDHLEHFTKLKAIWVSSDLS